MADTWSFLDTFFREARVAARNIDLMPPWRPIADFMGSPSEWLEERSSELAPPTLDNLDERMGSFVQAAVPRFGWLRTQPTSIPRDHRDDPFPDEAWFFINGIGTDVSLLRSHGRLLEKLFGRRLELIYNPTDGVVIDVLESLLGRSFDLASGSAGYAGRRVLDALSGDRYRKVVVLAHSQGGIIASNLSRQLVRDVEDPSLLEKLEIYTFASAADEMEIDESASEVAGRLVPYVEHFANTADPIARIGILQALDPQNGSRYRGEIYTLERRGHLFNTHYLPELRERAYQSRQRGRQARLYDYLDGGQPEVFPPLD